MKTFWLMNKLRASQFIAHRVKYVTNGSIYLKTLVLNEIFVWKDDLLYFYDLWYNRRQEIDYFTALPISPTTVLREIIGAVLTDMIDMHYFQVPFMHRLPDTSISKVNTQEEQKREGYTDARISHALPGEKSLR